MQQVFLVILNKLMKIVARSWIFELKVVSLPLVY